MPGSKSEKPNQNRPQQPAEGTSRASRSTSTPGGKSQSSRLKPPLKQSRGRSPSPSSRKKDEKKDSELGHNNKGYSEGSHKKDDKVDSAHKTRVAHHKAHDKHSEDDGSKFHEVNSKSHTSRHGKHHVDKTDRHKLAKPESSAVRSRSKSPNRSKQTESVEVPEKTDSKASMEREKCELIDDQPGSEKDGSSDEEGEIIVPSTVVKPVGKIIYTKKELMVLKTCELAQQRPAELTDEILNLLNSDANRPKYPATLSLRKEGNESRAFPDISLSPQRGSFSSGCKYKSNRESVNKDGSGDPPATPLSSRIQEEGSKFSFHDDNATQKEFSQYRTPHGPQSSSQFSWQRSQSSSTYRDYNGGSTSQDDDNRTSCRPSYSRYSQSYQQESYRGNGNSRGYHQSESYSEPEPEWMQFGPSSRTEFMELGGEDEIEKMREEFKARQKKVDKVFNKNASQDNAETPSDASDKNTELALSSSPDVITTHDDEVEHNSNVFDDNNNYCNDETMSEQQVSSDKDEGYKMAAANSNPPTEEQSLLSANTNDEFEVDLSRILNICDDIEDDDMLHQQQSYIHPEGSQLSKLFGTYPPKHLQQQRAQFPNDPSNLLMQVLGVQRDGQMNSYQEPSQKSLVVGNKPANALTLDEVLAKENISVTGEDQGDQSAFKKFLASIQQQQPHDNLSSPNSVMENNRHFNDTTHLARLFSSQERGARDSLEQYSFSLQHDQQQLDEQSQPLPIGYNRYTRQMEQQQNITLPHQFYMHDEERMSSKEMCNSEQQRVQQSSLQPPVQRIDQKKLLEQHIQQDVQEHVRQHLEQQQRQRAAAQFRQQQQIQQQQQQQARMKHQHMMVMEQQKRAAVLSGGTGGMMYSSSLPPPQSHKPPMANQPLGFMPTSVMKHNFKQTRTVPEMNKPSTRLEQDLNQKAVSTHSSLTGLISHSMPEDDHQFLQDQSRPHYGYSLPRMSMPPHGGGPRYPLPPHHHPPHHMMGAPPPPGYPMMGPAHPHHMPPFPSKHNSLPQGYFSWN